MVVISVVLNGLSRIVDEDVQLVTIGGIIIDEVINLFQYSQIQAVDGQVFTPIFKGEISPILRIGEQQSSEFAGNLKSFFLNARNLVRTVQTAPR